MKNLVAPRFMSGPSFLALRTLAACGAMTAQEMERENGIGFATLSDLSHRLGFCVWDKATNSYFLTAKGLAATGMSS